MPRLRRDGRAGRRRDHRRGQARAAVPRRERRLRPLDAEGAVPRRGEEDHGLRVARGPRPAARRDPLPNRRRHGPDRDVEGVRRDAAPRLDRRRAPAHVHGAVERLRADRPRARAGARQRAGVGVAADVGLGPARAARDRRPPDAARAARLARRGHRRRRRADRARRRGRAPVGRRRRRPRGGRGVPGAGAPPLRRRDLARRDDGRVQHRRRQVPLMARGIALFLGVFTLLNLAGDLRFAGASGNVWWLDVPLVPLALARVLLAFVAVALLWFALAHPPRAVTLAAATFVLVAAVSNAVVYYALLARGAIHSRVPLPLSLLIAASMLVIVARRGRAESKRSIAIAFVASAIVFPIA